MRVYVDGSGGPDGVSVYVDGVSSGGGPTPPTPSLPYDAEVEYLESTGEQYIDTGYSFNSATDKVEFAFEMLSTSNYKWIFGAYDTKRLAIGSGDGTNHRTFAYNNSTSYIGDSYYTNGLHLYSADSSGASIDGHAFFNFANFTTTSHIYLYSIPLDTTTYCANARIWSYKHYRNSVLVRDMIPVRVGTTGYLYDRANPTGGPLGNGLYPNSGTGDFVLGRDVNPISARSYVKDGLIAMWDGIENAGWGQHNPNATTWVDLTGNHTLTHESTPEFTADAFVLPGNMKIAYCDSDLFLAAVKNNSVTCEFCFKGYSVGGNNSILSLNRSLKNSSERSWWQWGNISFGYRLYSGSTWVDASVLPEGESPAVTLSFPLTDCYKNGTLVHSGPQPASNSVTGKVLQIGMIGSHTSIRDGYTSMRADIHSIRIYSRALSAAEIAANYAVDVKRFDLEE